MWMCVRVHVFDYEYFVAIKHKGLLFGQQPSNSLWSKESDPTP